MFAYQITTFLAELATLRVLLLGDFDVTFWFLSQFNFWLIPEEWSLG